MSKAKTFTSKAVVAMVAKLAKDAGSQRALARKWGLSAAYVNDVIHERREPGDGILKHLGIAKETHYTTIYSESPQ